MKRRLTFFYLNRFRTAGNHSVQAAVSLCRLTSLSLLSLIKLFIIKSLSAGLCLLHLPPSQHLYDIKPHPFSGGGQVVFVPPGGHRWRGASTATSREHEAIRAGAVTYGRPPIASSMKLYPFFQDAAVALAPVLQVLQSNERKEQTKTFKHFKCLSLFSGEAVAFVSSYIIIKG